MCDERERERENAIIGGFMFIFIFIFIYMFIFIFIFIYTSPYSYSIYKSSYNIYKRERYWEVSLTLLLLFHVSIAEAADRNARNHKRLPIIIRYIQYMHHQQ